MCANRDHGRSSHFLESESRAEKRDKHWLSVETAQLEPSREVVRANSPEQRGPMTADAWICMGSISSQGHIGHQRRQLSCETSRWTISSTAYPTYLRHYPYSGARRAMPRGVNGPSPSWEEAHRDQVKTGDECLTRPGEVDLYLVVGSS